MLEPIARKVGQGEKFQIQLDRGPLDTQEWVVTPPSNFVEVEVKTVPESGSSFSIPLQVFTFKVTGPPGDYELHLQKPSPNGEDPAEKVIYLQIMPAL